MKSETGHQIIHLSESIHSEKDTINEHFHETYQILYVLENEGELNLSGKKYSFNPDQVAFIAPFSKHSILAHTKLAILVLEFEPDILDSSIHKEILDKYLTSSQLIQVNQFEAMEIRQLLRKMLYQQSLGGNFDRVGLQIYLLEILYLLARSQQEAVITDANMLRAEKLKKYIDTNYFNVMNSNDIAAKLGVSSRHVNTIFKEQYNKTPLQYLTEVRLEAAKKLLMETDKDIISICFEVGFESLSTFYRTFNNYMNTSPKKYRAANNHTLL
ncbi:AraC family transcriptional regulator [Virgibacillus halodenitrificans]|uniref:Helix-turn-helix domain-containing protein n=1 Tax=Virgibacillus halodenitrificans TaxID=1482 RepID=A0ABR7VQB8_VIRHA|nr:AraC family transcriptional regulator [Virgibacillus halodenitrificans]MBD1223853.1 helix-turn-helix domain-containing protein [Virgibacillus halodenitrificans]